VTTLANIATHTAQVARTIPGRRARHVATLADLLANRLPDTSRVIAATLAAHDGYPCSASGADAGPRPRGGISRPTERHALARHGDPWPGGHLSLKHISEPTIQAEISYAVFLLKKKNSRARFIKFRSSNTRHLTTQKTLKHQNKPVCTTLIPVSQTQKSDSTKPITNQPT